MVVANSFAKEVAIRRRIINIYNKREEDFPSLKGYNDYLEEVEDMTFNLIQGIDVAAIEAEIAKYEADNAEQILNARACKAEELAAALATSKGPSQVDTEVATELSSQAGMSSTTPGQYAPTVTRGSFMQPRPTGMAPQPVSHGGGDMNFDDEEMIKLRAERGGRAGGWIPEYGRKRTFEEAFGSLWI